MFLLSEIKLGRYKLIVDFIGFERFISEPFGLSKEGVTKDFGKIGLLFSNENELQEVEVRVDKPLITTSINAQDIIAVAAELNEFVNEK